MMYPDTWLLTLADLQTHLGLSDDEAAQKRANLFQAIRQASADITTYLNRLPLPHTRVLEYDLTSTRHLGIDADLLSITALSDPDDSVIDSTVYRAVPLNRYPRSLLELRSDRYGSWQAWAAAQGFSALQTVTLTGTFGYAPHWDYAWETVTQAELDASATALAVADAAQFSIGDMLRMESEHLFVRDITADSEPATSGTLTLRRAALGTASAAHAAGTDIERFLMLDVVHANAVEWAAYLEKSRGRVGERVQVSEQGLLVVNDLSPLVKAALLPHRRPAHVKILAV